MAPNTHKTRKNENGNVLFYILIAVALLAALSFAISRGGQGTNKTISQERSNLLATEILEFSNTMGAAVSQLRLRGVAPEQMCFDDPAWGADNYDHAGCTDNFNRIFNVQGAGLNWTQAPSEAMRNLAAPDNLWHIYGDNEIQDIGTTCGTAACSDLVLIVDELNEAVCSAINLKTGVTNTFTTPPVDTNIGETRYIGAFGYASTIGDEAGSALLAGRTSGCFRRASNDEYVFYKVLITR